MLRGVFGLVAIIIAATAMLAVEAKKDSNDFVHEKLNISAIICRCEQIYNPICGSDLVTYKNFCFYECENRRRIAVKLERLKMWNGECIKADCFDCPQNKSLICGSDHRIYKNSCFLECRNSHLNINGFDEIRITPGICNGTHPPGAKFNYPIDCQCLKKYSPICGDDGVYYNNKCMFDCKNIALKWLSLSPLKKAKDTVCNDPEEISAFFPDCACGGFEYEPICGSDGITYFNPCWFRCKNRTLKRDKLPQLDGSGGKCKYVYKEE